MQSYAYNPLDSPEYARHMIDRLTKRSIQIAHFPLSGRKVPEYDQDKIREVIEKPYRIIYSIMPQQIDILAIVHSARASWEED